MRKDIKKLAKAYNKKLNEIAKYDVNRPSANAYYLAEYLHFLRDCIILTEQDPTGKTKNDKLESIMEAIYEFDSAMSCAKKYFRLDEKNELVPLDGTKETARELYMSERKAHMYKFWTMVNNYMDIWEVDYASIQ